MRRVRVELTIEKTLNQGFPATYDQALFTQKRELVYQHIYNSYFGQGRSIYEHVGCEGMIKEPDFSFHIHGEEQSCLGQIEIHSHCCPPLLSVQPSLMRSSHRYLSYFIESL